DLAAVEVAVEIEQERFEEGCAVVEGWAGAEVCGTCIMVTARGDAHGIDAVGQRGAWGQGDVGGGKAQTSAALGAAAYHACHPPPPAQHLGCSLNVTQRQLGADGTGGEDLACLGNLADDGDTKPQRFCGPLQALRIAGASLAEAEVVADHDLARA